MVAAGVAGHAYGQSLGQLFGQAITGPKPSTATPLAAPAPIVATVGAGRQSLVMKGYSEKFQAVRELIGAGRYEEALAYYEIPKPDAGAVGAAPAHAAADKPASPPAGGVQAASAPPHPLIADDPFLANVEAGLILFETGLFPESAAHFSDAEQVVAPKAAAQPHGAKKFMKGLAGDAQLLGAKAIGDEELGPYRCRDHEVVLQLNYLALGYLLRGDHRCYNVARRCIDEQISLKKKFDVAIADYKAKLAEQQAKTANSKSPEAASFNGLSAEFQAYDGIADRVPNAYVNPVGDYLDGLIQEIASKDEPPLRDNSRISYESASALCGGAAVMTAAAAAMRRPRAPDGERIAHVIVGEGFAPERQVMTYGIPVGGKITPLRVPIFTPTASPIGKVEAQTATGLRMASLDVIGDVEAIVLRDQHDRTPETMLGVITAFLASYGEGQLLKSTGLFGQAAMMVRERNASPDTRAWSSLPRRFHVGRVVLPKKVTTFQLATFGTSGGLLSRQRVVVDPLNSHSVIYARAIDNSIRVISAQRLWIDGRLERPA
jgi:hypothetical protein